MIKAVKRFFLLLIFLGVLGALFFDPIKQRFIGGSADLGAIEDEIVPKLDTLLADRGLTMGAPLFIRIFKEERDLEVWMSNGEAFQKLKTYPICNYSGHLGPKLAEGDRQSPEGFYSVPASAMNPNSRFHLSFNLGFPNAFDRSHERTGSYLMVHGDCLSIGCYAMTDAGIEEIYALVDAAQQGGQAAVPVHAFPFHMTDARLQRETEHEWFEFWSNLKEGYDLFEAHRTPPAVSVDGKRYVFDQT